MAYYIVSYDQHRDRDYTPGMDCPTQLGSPTGLGIFG